jgi:hypothetical protein
MLAGKIWMSHMENRLVAEVINTGRYPLTQPLSPEWKRVVAQTKHDLDSIGCCVLSDFIRPERCIALQAESSQLAPFAYYRAETVNAYNTDVTAPWPHDHPGRITMERGNAFVPRDCIPPNTLIHRLYTSSIFQTFIAHCFELEQIHELADPLAALCVNVVSPGREHPWHFDTNEFTVSLLTQEQEDGGFFEYCHNIRSSNSENFEQVDAVLAGRGSHLVRRLWLRPGDLQLFKGRYSLHRVSPVTGGRARHSAIFAYTERPGVIGSVSRTRQLFGRVLPQHLAAADEQVRVDRLLD